jgi:hypothetical protein
MAGAALAWGTLIAVSYFMMACIGVMLRAQWAQRELWLFHCCVCRSPSLRMRGTRQCARFFRNPLTWIGMGIAFY